VLAVLAAQAVFAEQPSADELADLSLEQLLEVPLVSVASKHPQKAEDAPSVIAVVTAEEIRRHGYRTLADVLRTLPGLYVSYDRNYSYVGARGLGRPGDYNTRILLLVDGIRINDNIYDGAYVGEEMPLDLDVIERVEVSRGPGAATHGNSAFFGVVNIVTRRGGRGGQLRAGLSSYGTFEGGASYGRDLADGAQLLVAASGLTSRGQSLQFPEFSSENGGVVEDGDGEGSAKAFAAYSKGRFAIQALHSARTKHIPTASYGTLFGDTRAMTRDTFTALAASYERPLGARLDWTNRVSLVAYDYEGAYPYDAPSVAASVYEDYGSGRWWTAESTGVLKAGRHTLILGSELTHNLRQDQGGGYAGDRGFELPDQGVRWGAFAQDSVALVEHLLLSIGGRYDRNEHSGGEWNPRIGLMATPAAGTSVKLLYGTAYRAPNEYEQHYYTGQGALRPESITSVEAVAERRFGDHVRASVSLFSNDIHDLITLQSNASGDLVFRNTDRARSRGWEASIDSRFESGLATRLSYSYQRTQDGDDKPLSNSPAHMVKGAVTAPVPEIAGWLSVGAQYMSSRLTLDGADSGDSLLVDATLLVRLGQTMEASASIQNVLDHSYADPGSEEHRQDLIPQNGRSFALSLAWSF
jgi:iron complex outermembrane receptor protein